MSLSSKLFLGCACGLSVGIIGYVHFKQQLDRDKLHEGVIMDVERQRRRQAENIYNLQKQIDLTKELNKTYENDLR